MSGEKSSRNNKTLDFTVNPWQEIPSRLTFFPSVPDATPLLQAAKVVTGSLSDASEQKHIESKEAKVPVYVFKEPESLLLKMEKLKPKALAGDYEAQCYLARMYYLYSIYLDESKLIKDAIFWCKQAINTGARGSFGKKRESWLLAFLKYISIQETDSNTKVKVEAFEPLYSQSIKYGCEYAMTELGLLLQELVRSKQLFYDAASLNDSVAQFLLGSCFEEGCSDFEVDLEEAAKWYDRAAQQGHVLAQFRLGMLCCENSIAPYCYSGIEWLTAAANQGLQEAREQLAFFSQQEQFSETLKMS
jgi:TPR repeat protein